MWVTLNLAQLSEQYLDDVHSHMRQALLKHAATDSRLMEMFDYLIQISMGGLTEVVPLAVAEGMDQDPTKMIPFASATTLMANAFAIRHTTVRKLPMRFGARSLWRAFGQEEAFLMSAAMELTGLDCIAHEIGDPDIGGMMQRLAVSRVVNALNVDITSLRNNDQDTANPDALLARELERVGPMVTAGILGSLALCGLSPEKLMPLLGSANNMGGIYVLGAQLTGLYHPQMKLSTWKDMQSGQANIPFAHFQSVSSTDEINQFRTDLGQMTPEIQAKLMAQLEAAGTVTYMFDQLDRLRREAKVGFSSVPEVLPFVDGIAESALRPIKPAYDQWIDNQGQTRQN